MQKGKLYIAYGSNMNLAQMKQRCPTAKVVGKTELKDFELVFRGSRNSAVVTIEPCEGGKVPLLLWRIQPQDEKFLDRYEGYPNFYEKEYLEIDMSGKQAFAMVYVMTPGYELGKPSEYYKKTIVEGYQSADFDTDILNEAINKTMERMGKELKESDGQKNLFGLDWW